MKFGKWKVTSTEEARGKYAFIREQYRCFDRESLLYEKARLQCKMDKHVNFSQMLLSTVTVSIALLSFMVSAFSLTVKQAVNNETEINVITICVSVIILTLFFYLIYCQLESDVDQRIRLQLITEKLETIEKNNRH